MPTKGSIIILPTRNPETLFILKDVPVIFNATINLILSISALLFFLLLIYGIILLIYGIILKISTRNEQKIISQAKSKIIKGILGLSIILVIGIIMVALNQFMNINIYDSPAYK